MKEDRLQKPSRRNALKKQLLLSTAALSGVASLTIPTISFAASLTRGERDAMTPDQVIERFRQGNLRFRQNRMAGHDYLAQKRSSSAGQFPAAVILGCIDSRTPPEIVLDAGIGDTFCSRVAGNVSDSDVLGSMEFACALAGAKLVLVMGHTRCGAVRGAIDNAKLGNLTGLLDKIKPAIAQTSFTGERAGSNYDFVDAVARKNVELTIKGIRTSSPVLKDLEDTGKIKIVGSMYRVAGGNLDFFEI